MVFGGYFKRLKAILEIPRAVSGRHFSDAPVLSQKGSVVAVQIPILSQQGSVVAFQIHTAIITLSTVHRVQPRG